MEWQDILTELVQFVEQAAPMVWAIARRQVLVRAIQDVLWMIGSGALTIRLLNLGRSSWRKYKEDERSSYDMAAIAAYVGVVTCGFFGLYFLCTVIGQFVNPDYYAIKLLLQFAE